MVKMNTTGNANPVKVKSPLFTGLVYAFVFMGICTLVLSLMLWLSNFQEHSLSTAAFVIHAVAVLAGGFTAGRNTLRKGWLNGGSVGLVYTLIIMLVGFLGFDAGLNLQSLLLLAICLAAGAIGGMLGVNMRR
jgi:putative membrane protein (TIGR04086 family)